VEQYNDKSIRSLYSTKLLAHLSNTPVVGWRLNRHWCFSKNLVYYNCRTMPSSKTCTSFTTRTHPYFTTTMPGCPNTTEIRQHLTSLCGDNTKLWSRRKDVCNIADLSDKNLSQPAPQMLILHAGRHSNFTWTSSITDTHPQTLNSSTKHHKFRAS
jgi:hypothetical protein